MTHSSHNIAPGSCFCTECNALMGADREDLLAPCRGKQRVIDNYDAWQKAQAEKAVAMTEQPKDGGAAFPTGLTPGHYSQEGMSLRDWFAGMALASGAFCETTQSYLADADKAYKWADAMISAREATQ